MFTESVENIANVAAGKRDKMNESMPRYMLAALLAGAYVGIGIILIFTLGALWRPSSLRSNR